MIGRDPLCHGLQTLVIPAGYTYDLPTDESPLPQALGEAGEKTLIIGMWLHGHADPKYWHRQRGFDYEYGPLIGEIDYFTHGQHGVVDWYRDNKRLVPGRPSTNYSPGRTSGRGGCHCSVDCEPRGPSRMRQAAN